MELRDEKRRVFDLPILFLLLLFMISVILLVDVMGEKDFSVLYIGFL